MGLKLLIENDLKCAKIITAFPDSVCGSVKVDTSADLIRA